MSTINDFAAHGCPSAAEKWAPAPAVSANGILTRQVDEAEVTFQVNWAERTAFFNCVAGLPQVLSYLGGAMVRYIPLQHPYYRWMYADDFRETSAGFDGSNPAKPARARSFVTVHFRSLPYDVSGINAFMEISSAPASRVIPMPASDLATGGGANPDAPYSGLEVKGQRINLTFLQVVQNRAAYWDTFSGCVNAAALQLIAGDATFPRGTLLFLGPEYSRSVSLGQGSWRVNFPFQSSRVDWNAEFVGGTLQAVSYGGTYRYPYVDLTQIFAGS